MKKTLVSVLAAVMLLSAVGCAFAANMITIEEAKQIAFAQAGVTADQVLLTKSHLDRDDGRTVYDIEFYVGSTEYDLDIDAYTGKITEFETENKNRDFSKENITEDEAKLIATAYVNKKIEDVAFTKCHLDRDDGRTVFEMKFVADGMEYEFDIDAATGAISDFDVDLVGDD